MRNLIEKLIADGGEFLYIVRRPGETAAGLASGAELLEACYNTSNITRSIHYAALDVAGAARWYEPEDAEEWATEALIVADDMVTIDEVVDMANRARTHAGQPHVSVEAILSAYIAAKHGADHE